MTQKKMKYRKFIRIIYQPYNRYFWQSPHRQCTFLYGVRFCVPYSSPNSSICIAFILGYNLHFSLFLFFFLIRACPFHFFLSYNLTVEKCCLVGWYHFFFDCKYYAFVIYIIRYYAFRFVYHYYYFVFIFFSCYFIFIVITIFLSLSSSHTCVYLGRFFSSKHNATSLSYFLLLLLSSIWNRLIFSLGW